eukprot:snap_masked-scaffold63_size435493-processed-gene-2.4 protein:Tk00826 transcript:snap_masked-scaffold63_size435493-processed-gene-2.4-mRNA-1 annotation:"phosphatidate phosphatase lpin3"
MSFLTRNVFQPLTQWYSEINSATLTGAIDVLVVEQADGSLLSSPFHVRFGKLGVLRAKEKIVDLEINEESVDIQMKLDDTGAAFFVEDVSESESEEIPPELATSPIPESDILLNSLVQKAPSTGSRSLIEDFNSVEEGNSGNGKWKQQGRKKRKRRLNHRRGGSKSSLREMGVELREGSSESSSSFDIHAKKENDSQEMFNLEDNDNDGDLDDDDTETPTNSVKAANPVAKPHRDQSKSTTAVKDTLEPSATTPESSSVSKNENSEQSFLESRLGDQPIESILQTQEKLDKAQSSQRRPNTNYYSEPEMISPEGSRPSTPILSDTEYETKRQISTEEQSWEWGQLPSTSLSPPKPMHKEMSDSKLQALSKGKDEVDSRQRSWTFSFWKSKEDKRQPDGVYLDDLKGDDELMAIYLGKNAPGSTNLEDDVESGNGPSLPMSPHSVDGAIGGAAHPHRYDHSSDEEQRNHLIQKTLPDIAFSLCGGLEDPPQEGQPPFSNVLFEQSLLSFDDFVMRLRNKEEVLNNPNLVVRIGEQYYTWQAACPMIMSAVLFGRTLPSDLVDLIKGSYQEVRTKESSPNSKSTRTSSWWPFGRKLAEDGPDGEHQQSLEEGIAASIESIEINVEDMEVVVDKEEVVVKIDECPKEEADLKLKIPDPSGLEFGPDRLSRGSSNEKSDIDIPSKKYKKTLRLSSEALIKLNLRPGVNEATFSVTTAYQGTSWCKCHIYKWKYTDKIVVSDIDGTITKSDVLGHVLPIIGRDWAQSGVASLFSKIADNGYHIVYLSARAIGQASVTKDYLASIRQGNLNLPDGPLFLNPTSLVNAFHREVIERKPEKFKIACLRDIQKLFPEDRNPFYAGYGNRVNDVFAYRTVGIPISRIFTINSRGELRHELTQTFQTSYDCQSSIVDHLFPPVPTSTMGKDSPDALNKFSSFWHWREPATEINPALLERFAITNEPPKEPMAKTAIALVETCGQKPQYGAIRVLVSHFPEARHFYKTGGMAASLN